MAEENQPQRKFKDRIEYLAFIKEQKELKAKEAESASGAREFTKFEGGINQESKAEKPQKEYIDTLRSILSVVNDNNKISQQILAKLSQKAIKETAPQSTDLSGINKSIKELNRIAESLQSNSRPIPAAAIPASQAPKIIENRPIYNVTNVRQYQYKRNPRLKGRSKNDGLISGLGRRVGTHIGGRALGNVVANTLKIGGGATSGLLKMPFKLTSKGVRMATGGQQRNALVAANRVAETSKFRKKMIELLGLISKKTSTGAAAASQTESGGGGSFAKTLAMAAGIGAAVLGLKALVDNMSKETKDKIKKFLYDVQERLLKSAKSVAFDAQEKLKKWLYDNNPLKGFGEYLGSKVFDFVSTLNGFGEKLGSKIFDIVNGIEKAYDSAKAGVEKFAGKAADKAMEVSTAVYNAPGKAADAVSDAVVNSPPVVAYKVMKADHIAQNKMPDYKGGQTSELSNLSDKIVPGKEYDNIANKLNKPNSSPSLKQLESQQKQANEIQRDNNKKSQQPIIINKTNNNTKEAPKQPSMVRLGTRNLDSSKQQLDRSVLSGGYMGTGFLVN